MSHSVNRLDIAFLAGFDQVNQPVFENLTVELLNADTEEVRLLKSPLLTRNLAAGDKIRPTNPERGEYDLIERSGNLSIRVFCRGELDSLANTLTPEIEKLGGSLDLQTERALSTQSTFQSGSNKLKKFLMMHAMRLMNPCGCMGMYTMTRMEKHH